MCETSPELAERKEFSRVGYGGFHERPSASLCSAESSRFSIRGLTISDLEEQSKKAIWVRTIEESDMGAHG